MHFLIQIIIAKVSDVSIRAKKAFKNFYMIKNNTDEEIAKFDKEK